MKKKSLLGLAAWTMCAVGVQADDVMLLHTYNNETQRIVVDNIANIRHSQGQVIISLHEGDEVTLPIQEVKSITFQSLSTAIEQLSSSQANVPFRIYNLKGELLQEGTTDAEGKVSLTDELHGVFVVKILNTSKILNIK